MDAGAGAFAGAGAGAGSVGEAEQVEEAVGDLALSDDGGGVEGLDLRAVAGGDEGGEQGGVAAARDELAQGGGEDVAGALGRHVVQAEDDAVVERAHDGLWQPEHATHTEQRQGPWVRDAAAL